MKRRASVLIPIAVTASLALTACSGASESPGRKMAIDGTFTVAIDQDPGDLNPLLTTSVTTQTVGLYSYDTLLFQDPKTKVQPFLAESWTESPTKVTYTLRDDITCADGTAFTAQTAADNLNWILDPANGSPRLESVVPANAKVTAKANVLTVTTPTPRPFMLNDIGAQQLVCEGALENPRSVSSRSDGTGPFIIDDVVAGASIKLTRRKDYIWGPHSTTSKTPGLPRAVTIRIVPSPSTRANLLLAGDLNAAIVSGSDEDRLARLDQQPSPAISGMIVYNHFEGTPTADAAVRTALTQATDLDALTQVLTAGKGKRATSLLTEEPSLCTYDTIGSLPAFDPGAAAQTLEAAGYTKGRGGVYANSDGPLRITLVYDNSTDTRSAAAEYLAGQWEDLGVQVKLDGGDENYVIDRAFVTKDPSGWNATLGLNLQSGTPATFPKYLSGPAAPKGTNFASIHNAQYEKLSVAAAKRSGEKACDGWAAAEKALFAESDLIPVSVTPNKMYFSKSLALYPPVGGLLPGSAIRVLQ
ncbi:ABC transporter substrate-binding protein [Streptomyces scopuliridis]|uniref:ABC transporter substrate-binding protein n=1 Tax=Streptomyces scopuliridis TaxID=452529 RepID=UPI0036A04D50